MNNWLMGALAAQDNYNPDEGAYQAELRDAAQAYRGQPRLDPGIRRAPGDTEMRPAAQTFGEVGGGLIIPQTPLDYGLMVATGPRILGKGVKLAAGALGALFESDEAKAGKLATVKQLANPKLRDKADQLRGTYSQYAEQYPGVGPPELMSKLPDPKKPGKFLTKPGEPVPYLTMDEALAKDAQPGYFLQKKLTPEVEQFAKDRATIQKDMDLHGYEPYYDPSKRFDVDASKYGPFADTGVEGMPKSAKTQVEWSGKYGTDDIRARLRAGFERGKDVPDSDRWYFMGQLEKDYIKELGAKEGRAAFKREFADMMAATTGGASPYDNFLMSQYANVVNKQGQRLPERAYEMPFPIGGRFASGNMEQAQKYIDKGNAHWPADNSKRYDFSTAFQGNKNAGTIDEQMMTAFDPTLKATQPQWYGPATMTLRQEAQALGVDPRGFQDVGWAGLKANKVEGAGKAFEYEGPMINHINRSIETTHRLTGMPRDEIVRRGLVRKEIPMYGVAGATTMGGLAAQDDYKPRGVY